MAATSGEVADEEDFTKQLEEQDARERSAAVEAARALSREEQTRRYNEAVRQLNIMLGKAEQFNATCEKLASESPFLCKAKPRAFTGGELRKYQQEGVQWLSTKHW
jgi:SNF2 family DNA or RNA helicase